MNHHACIDALLISGLDDWIQAAEIAWVAQSVGHADTSSDVLSLSLRAIRALLEDGLVEVGMVTREDGFVPWEISLEEAMDRIEAEWRTKPKGPDLGEVCWLSLTEKGRARAETVWAHRQKSTTDGG